MNPVLDRLKYLLRRRIVRDSAEGAYQMQPTTDSDWKTGMTIMSVMILITAIPANPNLAYSVSTDPLQLYH